MLLNKKIYMITGAEKGVDWTALDTSFREGGFVFANDMFERRLEEYCDDILLGIMCIDVENSEILLPYVTGHILSVDASVLV